MTWNIKNEPSKWIEHNELIVNLNQVFFIQRITDNCIVFAQSRDTGADNAEFYFEDSDECEAYFFRLKNRLEGMNA